MTDTPVEKPPETRSWCPGCEPDLDETRELVHVSRCGNHAVLYEGADDALISPGGLYLSGGAEGLDNARWCALLHRGSTTR